MRQVKQLRVPLFRAVAAAALAVSLGAAGDELIVGATTHFAMGRGIVAENLQVFKESGMLSPRDEIYWFAEEKKKGVYSDVPHAGPYFDAATAMGLEPLLLFNGGNKLYDNSGYPQSEESLAAYANFCAHYAAMYKGKIKLYQIWNEWDDGGAAGISKADIAAYMGRNEAKAQMYVALLAKVYPKMKAANPEATVIANSVCTGEKFLEETLKAGVLKNCDGISFHAYNYRQFGTRRLPEAFIERVSGVDKLLKRYNDGKEFPIYITEIGWPNYITGGGSTDAESGDFIARVYLCAKTVPAIKGLWWYDFQDDGLDPEYSENNFGIVRSDLTPKEPFQVIRSIAHIVAKGKFVGKLETGDEKVVALKFKMPDGTDALAAWSLYEDVDVQVAFKNAAASKSAMQVYYAGFAKQRRDWGARDWVVKSNAPFVPDEFLLTLRGGRPWILEGELSQVSIVRLVKRTFPRKRLVVRVPVEAASVPSTAAKSAGKTYNFGDPKSYRSIDGETCGGKQDLDANFSLRWDARNLYLKVEVTDSAFHQDHAGAETWMGDGIQVAFQDIERKTLLDFSEFALALTKNGPEAYGRYGREERQEGLCKDMAFDIKQEGAKTVYSIEVPAAALGMKEFKAGALLGFSLLVNDDDGKGRKGYLHWGDGIGGDKDPDRYNLIKLEE